MAEQDSVTIHAHVDEDGTVTYDEDAAEKIAGVVDRAHGGSGLFDGNMYVDPALKLETRDGRRIGTIEIAFTGGVELQRLLVSDVDLFKRLRLGQEVEFLVTGVVAADTTKEKVTKDTTTVVGRKTIRIHSLEEQ